MRFLSVSSGTRRPYLQPVAHTHDIIQFRTKALQYVDSGELELLSVILMGEPLVVSQFQGTGLKDGWLARLQLCQEEETATHILSALEADFRAVLTGRGVPTDDYQLLLPPQEEAGAVWVEPKDVRGWPRFKSDARLDEISGAL